VTRVKAGAPLLVLLAALAVCGVAAARTPTPAQKAAILAAFRSQQGDVAIQKIQLSSTDPEYAILNWGFAVKGMTAFHTSLVARSEGTWKVLWTRDIQDPANGACVFVPGPVARDLLGVNCPPPEKLRAHAATGGERRLIARAFRTSSLTPYAKSATSLSRICVSNANSSWAGAVAGFPSGGSVYVFFRHGKRWAPAFESGLRQGTPPPSGVVLSLATCVGYDPAAF
jgi:hypothetical protein